MPTKNGYYLLTVYNSSKGKSMSRLSRDTTAFRKGNIYAHPLSSRKRLQSIANVKGGAPKANLQEPKVCISNEVLHVNQHLASFNEINIPKSVVKLNVSKNNLHDFRGLQPLQNLKELDISYNHIESLLGFPILPSIQKITISGTPYGNTEYCRIALIILCKSSLRFINGENIKQCELHVANEYSEECAGMIRNGWIVTYPPPNAEEINTIKRKLNKKLMASKNTNRMEIQSECPPNQQQLQSKALKKDLESQGNQIKKLSKALHKLNSQKGA